eukprot:1876903-Pleurochrysis_carterae.AAC.1
MAAKDARNLRTHAGASLFERMGYWKPPWRVRVKGPAMSALDELASAQAAQPSRRPDDSEDGASD